MKILRGDFAGIEGKITDIETRSQRIYVEGVQREKTSGTSANVSVNTSKVVITKLNLDDKWRSESIKPVEQKSAAGAGA